MSPTWCIIHMLIAFTKSQTRTTIADSPFLTNNNGWVEENQHGSFQGGLTSNSAMCPSGSTCQELTYNDEFYRYFDTRGYQNIKVEYSIRTESECSFWWVKGTYHISEGTYWTQGNVHYANSAAQDVTVTLSSVDDASNFGIDFWADMNSGQSCYLNDVKVTGELIDPPTAEQTAEPTPKPSPSPTSAPTGNPVSAPTNQPTSGPTEPPSSFPSQYPTISPSFVPTTTPSVPPTAYFESREVEEETTAEAEAMSVQTPTDTQGITDTSLFIVLLVALLMILACCVCALLLCCGFYFVSDKNDEDGAQLGQVMEARPEGQGAAPKGHKESDTVTDVVYPGIEPVFVLPPVPPSPDFVTPNIVADDSDNDGDDMDTAGLGSKVTAGFVGKFQGGSYSASSDWFNGQETINIAKDIGEGN